MIPEIGLIALWLAASLALLQTALGALGLTKKYHDVAGGVIPVATVHAALTSFSFLCSIIVFLRSDMSVLLVASSSHSAKPLIYKFAGTWGNHEGSMLLWVSVGLPSSDGINAPLIYAAISAKCSDDGHLQQAKNERTV